MVTRIEYAVTVGRTQITLLRATDHVVIVNVSPSGTAITRVNIEPRQLAH